MADLAFHADIWYLHFDVSGAVGLASIQQMAKAQGTKAALDWPPAFLDGRRKTYSSVSSRRNKMGSKLGLLIAPKFRHSANLEYYT